MDSRERLLAALSWDEPDQVPFTTYDWFLPRGANERAIRELGLEEAVECRGWIPREELLELYRCARGFVYPSLFEGFGMPVLEALAAGVPAACSGIEPLRSLASGHALLFDPEDDDSMLDALRRLLAGEAPRTGSEYARRFTWARAAELTLQVLEDAYRRKSSS